MQPQQTIMSRIFSGTGFYRHRKSQLYIVSHCCPSILGYGLKGHYRLIIILCVQILRFLVLYGQLVLPVLPQILVYYLILVNRSIRTQMLITLSKDFRSQSQKQVRLIQE